MLSTVRIAKFWNVKGSYLFYYLTAFTFATTLFIFLAIYFFLDNSSDTITESNAYINSP